MPVRLNLRDNPTPYLIDLESRRRNWLGSGYEQHEWILRDTGGLGNEEVVRFDVVMADGRSLIDHPLLYGTAKELIFWMRAAHYAGINSAKTHAAYAQTVLRICYGMTARGIFSFASLTASTIDMMCVEGAMGIDGLLAASRRLKAKLAAFKSWDDVPPRLANPSKDDLVMSAVLDDFHLPGRWARREVKSEIHVAAARLNGKLLVSVADSKISAVTSINVGYITSVFDAVYVLRPFIEAPSIRFRPFPQGPAKKAVELGIECDQTPIAPPDLVMALLEQSVRHVAQHMENILGSYRTLINLRQASASTPPDAALLRTGIMTLAAACFILISAFTARRTEEIKLLERDCLAGNDADGWWMRCYIEKTERRRTWIPIPNIVAKAVCVLRSLNPAGEEFEGRLFEYMDPVTGKIVGLSPERGLNEFAKSVDAVKYPNANDNNEILEWQWQNRQFRRFFAVLYIWRYKGKFESLAHHLRHFDLDTTNEYVMLDAENAKIWTKEVWNFRIEVVRDLVSGRTQYSGPMGERLNKLAKRLRAKFSEVRIIPEVLAKTVIRQLDKASVVLTPKAWVTCCCPRNERGCEKAACRKITGFMPGDIGPNFGGAGPGVCPECPWALIGPENLGFIERELRDVSLSAANYNEPTIFSELQSANLMSLHRFVTES